MNDTIPDEVRLTRKQLYDLVWTEPVHRLAARYGLSDVGLAKLCRRHRVPVPERGYWAKVEAGHHPRRKALFPSDNADAEIVIRRTPKTTPSEETGRIVDPERLPENRITVPDQLSDPHPLVVRAQRSLHNGRRGERGVLASRAKRCLAMHVTRDALDRGLRVMDALVKALAVRGREVLVEGTGTTGVMIGDERLEFCLEEVIRQVEHKATAEEKLKQRLYAWSRPPRYDWVKTGTLQLRITNLEATGTRRSWSDGKRQRLEDCLNSFMAGLALAAEANKQERARRAEWQRHWEEQRRKEEELRRLRYLEDQRAKELERHIERWQRAQRVREYVAAAKQAGRVLVPEDEALKTFADWIDWATRYADRLDPLKGDPPPPVEPEVVPSGPALW